MRWTSSLYIFLYFRNKNERLVLECMKLAPKNIQIEWNLFVDGWRGTSVVVQRREGYLEERRTLERGPFGVERAILFFLLGQIEFSCRAFPVSHSCLPQPSKHLQRNFEVRKKPYWYGF